MELIPAILPKDQSDLIQKLAALPRDAKSVHIDFVNPPPTPSFIKEGAKGVDFLEAHLMVADPLVCIPDLVKNGFSRVLIHAEAVSAEVFAETIHEWRDAIEIGAALKIETPLDSLSSFVHELQTIQLMGIAHLGRQGEPFDERVIGRVLQLHHTYPNHIISVDGGVNKENAKRLTAAGAKRLVVGSAIKEFYG